MKVKTVIYIDNKDLKNCSELISKKEFQLIEVFSQDELLTFLDSYGCLVLIIHEDRFETFESYIKDFLRKEIPVIFTGRCSEKKSFDHFKYFDFFEWEDTHEKIQRKIANAQAFVELKLRNEYLKNDLDELQNKDFSILKRNLLSNLSHELRTPLNGILGFSHLLISDEVSYGRKREYYEFIEQSSERLINYVDNISELVNYERASNKLRIGTYTTHNLLNSLSEKYSNIAKAKGIGLTLTSNFPSEKHSILINGVKVYLIFSKLFSCTIYHSENCEIEFGIQDCGNNFIEFFYKEAGCLNSETNLLKSLMNDSKKEFYSLDNTNLESQIIRKYLHELKAKYRVDEKEFGKRKLVFKVPYTENSPGLKKRRFLR